MARFQEMRVLLAVTEAESFAGGAKLLGISPPSVTRAIAALEARFGDRVPRILLHAAICRRELAVEIDGVHDAA